MGQRQDKEEIVYGDDCLLMFDPDKTPKHIYARFSNIKTCPGAPAAAPNDRTFKLTQVPGSPCFWVHDIGDWYVSFHYFEPEKISRLFIRYEPTHDRFFWDTIEEYVGEGYTFYNEYNECVGVQMGIGGTAVLTWKLESLKVMRLLNIKPQHDLFMEMRPLVDDNRVYKFCRLEDATNIAIEYEPD